MLLACDAALWCKIKDPLMVHPGEHHSVGVADGMHGHSHLALMLENVTTDLCPYGCCDSCHHYACAG